MVRAAVRAFSAAAASISSIRLACSVSSVSLLSTIWAKPPSTNSVCLPSGDSTRSSPVPILKSSGARSRRMPTSPSHAGKATNVASVSRTARSGVMTLQWKVFVVAIHHSFAIRSACAAASSMVPTYMKAWSGRWSHLPSQSSSKERMVSAREQ